MTRMEQGNRIFELYPDVHFITGIALSTVINLSASTVRKWRLHFTLARRLRERLLKTIPYPHRQAKAQKGHSK